MAMKTKPNPLALVLRTSDGALLELVELALDEAQYQAGLPHRRLPKKHQLELADLIGRVGTVGSRGSTSVCHVTTHSQGLAHTLAFTVVTLDLG